MLKSPANYGEIGACNNWHHRKAILVNIMKKQASIFNPYSLFILGSFIPYFPLFFRVEQPSISLGHVHLFVSDIAFVFLLLYALFKYLVGQTRPSLKRRNMGRTVQIIFALFFLYSCLKFLLQNKYDTANIRMMLSFTPAYLFLFFFPVLITRKEEIRKLLIIMVVFLVYIFILHIYAFATQGYVIHILGGEFLSVIGILYFLAMKENELLKLSSTQSFIVKALVVTTYFMVGHRSGLIALLLGLIVYSFYYKKSAIKEISVLIIITIVSVVGALVVSPHILSGVEKRASTTFDTSQDTYQGRYNNIFIVLELSKNHPFIGKPLVTNETREMKEMKITTGNMTSTESVFVVTPHNLVLEWLLYYGWIGVLLGLSLLIAAFRLIKRFLREHKGNIRNHQIGVILLCTMTHNLFYAFSNVTTMDVYTTFFLYFPLVILVALSRSEENFCK